jgi:hypothetical protein
MTNSANAASVTFAVNRVAAATRALPRSSAKAMLEMLATKPVEASSAPTATVVRANGFHPLVEAVHSAFAEHYPLTLRPDDIWLTISQGFAACINADAEAYREKFVTHQGKEKIIIVRNEFVLGNANNDWAGCFAEFSDRIGEHIGTDKQALIVADFSTTGAIEKAASEVVLMDAVQAYFSYEVHTRCGIPTVTLLGSVADWQKVKSKAAALAQFGGEHLTAWLKKVDPILDQFVLAAEGKANERFWQDIYKGQSMSGGLSMDGWLLRLFPYTKDWYGKQVKNPALNGNGVNASQLPSSLSSVPFIWDYYGNRLDYLFLAGFTGVAQDEQTLAVSPVIGWAVRPDAKEK